MQIDESMYMPKDVIETHDKSKKANYSARYVPKLFWEDYGKFYYKTFKNKENVLLNIQPLMARIGTFQPKSVLEVGCGFGRCLGFVLESIKSINEIHGVELSQTMIDAFNNLYKDYENKDNVHITKGNAVNLPFKENEFELVYTHVCLTHIPPESIPAVVENISRVASKYIVHLERFRYLNEHPNPHRWSHDLVQYYKPLGWKVHEYDILNEKHDTKILVLRK